MKSNTNHIYLNDDHCRKLGLREYLGSQSKLSTIFLNLLQHIETMKFTMYHSFKQLIEDFKTTIRRALYKSFAKRVLIIHDVTDHNSSDTIFRCICIIFTDTPIPTALPLPPRPASGLVIK